MPNEAGGALETNIAYKILKTVLYTLLLTPIWVWSGFLFPFITSKIIFLRLLVELALALYIPLALRYPELRPRRDWLTRAVWIYLGVVLVTSIFGVNFFKSFWGTVERGEGIVSLLHFAAFFTMLSAVFRTPRDWRRYLTATVIMITAIALIGLGQLVCTPESGAVSQEGICGLLPPSQGTRISATIGNASFYAAFLLFGVFLSLLLAGQSGGKTVRRMFYLAALFNAYILVETQTRGGAIALFAAVFILLLHYVFRGAGKKRAVVAAVVLLVMMAAPAVIILKPKALPEPVRNIGVVYRLATISRSDITTQSRLATWNASWEGWKDRFWTGYGFENYNIAFNKYFPPVVFRDQGSQIWFDRAHNIIFDVALTSGALGLAAYFAIFVAAFALLYRLWRAGERNTAAILFSLLVAYFIQNFFVFDTQATYLLFFIILAYLTHAARVSESVPNNASSARVYDWGYLPGVAVAVAVAATAYFINWQPAAANYFTTQGIKATKLRQYRSVQPTFAKALSFGTYMDEEIRQRLVDYAHEAAGSGTLSPQEQQSLYEFVAEELEKNLETSPRDVKNYLYLMSVLNIANRELRQVDRVFDLGRTALELSPTRMQIYAELGQAAFLKNRPAEGLEYFRKGVELNPYPKESHFNYLLGSILAGREDLVRAEMEALRELGHALGASEYAAMARAYTQIKNFTKAIENYQTAILLRPEAADLHLRLAAVYGEICDLPGARQQIGETVRLEPAFQAQGQAIMEGLEKKCQS